MNELPLPLSNMPLTGTHSSGPSPVFSTLAFAPKLRSTPAVTWPATFACSFKGLCGAGDLERDGDLDARMSGLLGLSVLGDLLHLRLAGTGPLTGDLPRLSWGHNAVACEVD